MREIGIDELKMIEVRILKDIHEICVNNNLTYFLYSGTLIGAVRHNGFIPWDDDIDICMPRPDYEKLILILEKNERYSFLFSKTPYYYYTSGKIVEKNTVLKEGGYNAIPGMGVHIDVFPIDGLPNNGKERKTYFNQLCRLRNRINSFSIPKPKIRKNIFKYLRCTILYYATRFSNLERMQDKYVNMVRGNNFYNSDYVFITGGAYKDREIFSTSVFKNKVLLSFENEKYYAPEKYDICLSQIYGDYMTLPPVEKRERHHNFIALYR